MSRKKLATALAVLLFIAALFAAPLTAAIKAMTLEEMMDISTGVVSGRIIEKEYVKMDWGDDPDTTFTRIRISGEELTTGKMVTRDLYYVGGLWNGEVDSPSTAPREHQTRVGAAMVAFYWFDAKIGPDGVNIIFCFPNINQIQQGSGDPTVIGNGLGAAVPANVKLSALRTEVKSIYEKLQAKKQQR
jgi:hypothetical protein